MTRIRLLPWLRPGLGLLMSLPAVAQVHVLTYHNDNARTGLNASETLLTPANVNAAGFGRLFTYPVDGYVFAQPLYVSGLNLPGKGVHNVVFVATQHNSIYAFDADSNGGATGGLLWQTNLGPSAATPTLDFGTRYGTYNGIVPEVGITGTPVVDLNSGTLYVDTFRHDGAVYHHWLHALDITTGAERPSSPVLVAASMPGTGAGGTNGVVTFQASQQLQRCALTLAGGLVYIAYAGYDDTNPFHGWVLGFDSATLQLLPNYLFNTTPNSSVANFGPDAGEGGIWMGGGGPAVDAAGNLYLAVGNGSFNAFNGAGGTEYGDSFLRLATARGLSVADYFTPFDQANLSANDLDVGSGGLLLLPDQPGPVPHLMVGGGKAGKIYLLNRDQMTLNNNHYNASGTSDAVLQSLFLGGGVFDTPAYFNGAIYFAAARDVLAAFSVANSLLSTQAISTGPRTFNYPGATPSISANGTSQGIVWAVAMGSPAVLTASPAANLAAEIYSSNQAPGGRDQLPNGVKFVVPTIANGKVYVGGQYALSVFGLLGTPYDAWKSAHFGPDASNPAIAGDLADPDGDGTPNLFEYAFATDPNAADGSRRPAGATVSNRFQMLFRRNVFARDLTWAVQRADTAIGPYTNVLTYAAATGWVTNLAGLVVSEAPGTGTAPDQSVVVTVSETATADAASSRFFRVRIQH